MILAGNTAALAALKADILADAVLAAKPMNEDGAFAIAAAYNLQASPSFTVWKSLVPLNQVGMAFDFAAVAGLTTADSTRIQVMFQISPQGINAYLADRRAAFDTIFSGVSGNSTRTALAALWRRLATRAEKLFANTAGGNGADATPATLVQEGALSLADVLAARTS